MNIDIEQELYIRFTRWFENAGVDFWKENNAAEELALIAQGMFSDALLERSEDI